jgi:two-component system response regulator
MSPVKEVEVLLVEDDPGDVELIREGLKGSNTTINLNIVDDGIKAMKYLKKGRPFAGTVKPDVILLDLNLPGKDGWEVLREIKGDEDLKIIPVVILTTSSAEADLKRSHDLGADCYVTKPARLEEFIAIVQSIDRFWFSASCSLKKV